MKLTKAFFKDIRGLIVSARTTVARGADLVQVYTNFEIGRRIIEQEQKGKDRAAYGKEVLKALADRLMTEFGQGFSERNLASMRSFYLLYQDRKPILQSVTAKFKTPPILQSATAKSKTPSILQSLTGKLTPLSILQTLSAELDSLPQSQPRPFSLSWTHYVFLIGIKNADERSFYEIEATSRNWSVRELKRQFDTSLYERLALSRDKKGIRQLAQKGQMIEEPKDLRKEPLVLSFLGLDEQTRFSESDLETAIINRMEHFLLELGKGFLFESRQKRFTFDSENFFVDLVFYNRLLRCYILIDLKIGRLTHQDLGQMQMYVNYYDRHVKTETENATIGIILCKKKLEALVEITLPKNANIHAQEYQLYLPSKEELRQRLTQWLKEAEIGL